MSKKKHIKVTKLKSGSMPAMVGEDVEKFTFEKKDFDELKGMLSCVQKAHDVNKTHIVMTSDEVDKLKGEISMESFRKRFDDCLGTTSTQRQLGRAFDSKLQSLEKESRVSRYVFSFIKCAVVVFVSVWLSKIL